MPAEPSSAALSRLLKKPTPIKGNGQQRKIKPLDPSWMRTGFEGVSDLILGALGVGPDSKMNRAGQLVSAGIPMMGATRKMGRYTGNIKSQDFPTQNRLAMTGTPQGIGKPIYDDAGRFLAFEKAMDPAYEAHVASSVGKFQPQRKGINPGADITERMMKRPQRIKSMEESFMEKGR